MLSRRQFMLVLGGATTGLWLAATGLVHLERNFVLSLAGSCWFCGKERTEVRALVGAIGRAPQICDQCVGLCCDILAQEEVTRRPAGDRAGRAAADFLALDEESREKHLADALRRLEARGSRFPAVLAELRRASDAERHAILEDLRRSFDHVRRESMDSFRCSFCDAHRQDVAKLVSGPRVFICDLCVGDATAVVTDVLRAT